MDVDQREVHEGIVGTRNVLEREGFDRMSYEPGCGVCLIGAVGGALGECGNAIAHGRGSALARAVVSAIETAIPPISDDDAYYIAGWLRMDPGHTRAEGWAMPDRRTQAEVLALLDRAANATAPSPDLSFLSQPEEAPTFDLTTEEVVAR